MRKAIATLIGVGAWAAGLTAYCIILVHGIVLVINGAKASPTDAGTIAMGLVLIFVIAAVVAYGIIISGIALAAALWPSPLAQRARRNRRAVVRQRARMRNAQHGGQIPFVQDRGSHGRGR